MLKIITATRRLFFPKESTIFVILIVYCKTSGGIDLEGPLTFH